jgi:DNA-directed RNA polymerase subunit RPC12/RpoP
MFIVCPSCSGPYRIPADQIAPLVQTACPHCEYRIILDFEAANEPALREAGQQFAQGFESIEAYASVYDHVTSKPDAQPRLGVTSVTVQSETKQQVAAGGGQPARPLQRPESSSPSMTTAAVAAPVSTPAPVSEPAAGSAGNRHKTVIQVPSKKPVSMEPKVETPSPSLSGVTPAGTSMRAGKGVDVVEEPRVEEPKVEARAQTQSEPSDRKPPHTPPTTGVVSSGPPASETPTPVPEDITAQSGKHPVVAQPTEVKPTETKPAETPTTPVVKPPEPQGSNAMMYIIIVLIIGGVIAAVMMSR